MLERGKNKASIGDFIEAYLQLTTGRTSRPEMPEYNRRATTSHECGHAVQHACAYAPLRMRSALVPIVSFASNIMPWVLLGGMLLLHSFPQLMLFGIILFASTTLFSLVTLPVEINASQRALVWLSRAGITNVFTHDKAEDALKSAAYTYVVAALGSLATLLYYIFMFMGASRDE